MNLWQIGTSVAFLAATAHASETERMSEPAFRESCLWRPSPADEEEVDGALRAAADGSEILSLDATEAFLAWLERGEPGSPWHVALD